MKKLVLALLLAASTAHAQYPYHRPYNYEPDYGGYFYGTPGERSNSSWVQPAIVGAAIGYGISKMITPPQRERVVVVPVDVVENPDLQMTVYYCEEYGGFYPQVRQCPKGWSLTPAYPAQPMAK